MIIGDEVIYQNYLLNGGNTNETDDYGCITKKTEILGHTLCYFNVTGLTKIHREYFTTEYSHAHPKLMAYNIIMKCNPSTKTFQVVIGNSSKMKLILDKGTNVINIHAMGGIFSLPKLEIASIDVKEKMNGNRPLSPQVKMICLSMSIVMPLPEVKGKIGQKYLEDCEQS